MCARFPIHKITAPLAITLVNPVGFAPTDAEETLLQHVAGSRNDIGILPASKTAGVLDQLVVRNSSGDLLVSSLFPKYLPKWWWADNVTLLLRSSNSFRVTVATVMDFETKTLLGLDRNQLHPGLGLGRDHPTRTNWNCPAIPFRHRHFDTVKVGFGAPAFLTSLKTLIQYPAIHFIVNALLFGVDCGAEFVRTAQQIERPPGQQAGDGVEVGRIYIATQFDRFKGDRPHAGKASPTLSRLP